MDATLVGDRLTGCHVVHRLGKSRDVRIVDQLSDATSDHLFVRPAQEMLHRGCHPLDDAFTIEHGRDVELVLQYESKARLRGQESFLGGHLSGDVANRGDVCDDLPIIAKYVAHTPRNPALGTVSLLYPDVFKRMFSRSCWYSTAE